MCGNRISVKLKHMRFREPRLTRTDPAKARDLVGEQEIEPVFDVQEQVPPELAEKLRGLIQHDLNKDIALVGRDFFHHMDTFHLLFPDQQLGLTPPQIQKIRQIFANTKQRMKGLQIVEEYARFAEKLAVTLSELPEARKVYPSGGMRALVWKPDEARCFVEDRDIEPWIQFLETDPRMKQSKIGDVGGCTLSKSFLVLSFLRPELKPRLRPLAERLVKNGMARHGFALGHDVMRALLDLRVVFPDLSLPDQPYRKDKQDWIQGWQNQLRQDRLDKELLNNYSGTAIFLTGEHFYLDETGKMRYTLNRPLNPGRALPMREAI